jgi:ectoine hydroxylase-related dioxygenase (phytanoyl-CoA dioxygenase family)
MFNFFNFVIFFFFRFFTNPSPLSSTGDIILFDYKTLHRGPANQSNSSRPMMSLVFSKPFFLNSDAIVNRGISIVQTMHQRRYWEQFYYHHEQYFKV